MSKCVKFSRRKSVYEEFDPVPIASASLAQVHVARTHDGQKVAVKVQHMHMTDTAAADHATVDLIVKTLHWVFPSFDYRWLVDEMQESLPKELYGAAEFELSERPLKDIYDEAVAANQVTYEYAIKVKEVGKCGFASKVAGTALCKFYASESGEKYLCCAPSVLKELFG